MTFQVPCHALDPYPFFVPLPPLLVPSLTWIHFLRGPRRGPRACALGWLQRLWETAALGATERFNAISIQFALHYMFKTEESALTFFRNISDRLLPGGTLLITVPDANVIVRRLRNLPEGELEFGNDL